LLMPTDETGQPFSKCGMSTVGIDAPKAFYLELNPYLHALNRQVLRTAVIVAVYCVAAYPTGWTGLLGYNRLSNERNVACRLLNFSDLDFLMFPQKQTLDHTS